MTIRQLAITLAVVSSTLSTSAALAVNVDAMGYTSIEQHYNSAINIGFTAGVHEACKLRTDKLIAAIDSYFDVTPMVVANISASELKTNFSKGRKFGRTFKPSPDTPCTTQSTVDQQIAMWRETVASLRLK